MTVSVYMLRWADDSFYVGSANDLAKRLVEHQSGAYTGYTHSRRPVRLVWSESFERAADAVAAERKIKGWSRAKKLALIDGDWGRVRQLSKRRAGNLKLSPSS